MARRGLLDSVNLRHDEHYVEALVASSGEPIGRKVPIDQVDPNPNQPRQVMGDLSELMASIADKGIIEPLVVRQRRGRFQIIAGERRYQASVQVGLSEVPVVIRDVDDAQLIEIALVENLQRKDLSPFEEAEAMDSLVKDHRLKHDDLARRLGKSRTSVTESLSLNSMPDKVRELCRLADITSKSVLLQIVRQGKTEKMIELVKEISSEGTPATRARARAAVKQAKPGRPKSYIFKYSPPAKSFNLSLKFRKSKVARKEIISALTGIIKELKRES